MPLRGLAFNRGIYPSYPSQSTKRVGAPRGSWPEKLELLEFEDGVVDIVGLGEDDVFQYGMVGDEGVHGGEALYRGVEVVE